MIRRELIGMVAALALTTFSGLRVVTETSSPTARTEASCTCCTACDCPSCYCVSQTAGCDCCGGATCCSSKANLRS